jgi:hypothetical protein
MVSGRFYVANGILFIKNSTRSIVPLPYQGEIFFVNETCISVLAMHEQDGRCKISLGQLEEISLDREPDFRHTIDVPSRKVIVMLVPRVEVLALAISGDRAAVSVWMNDPVYANEVLIGIEQLADERRSV